MSKYKLLLGTFFLIIISYGQKKNSVSHLLAKTDSLYKEAVLTNNDSLKSITLKKYINFFYKNKDWNAFQKVRLEQIKLAHILKDTLSIARNYEYAAAYFKKKHKIDSVFYYYKRSYEVYESLKDSLNAGFMLLNLGILKKNCRDYSGAEARTLKAKIYLKDRANPRRLASVYNNLAIIYDNLKEFDNSLNYHLKTLKIRKEKVKDSIYFIHSLNNIGDLYIGEKKYNESLSYLKEAMSYEKLLEKNLKVKAVILDNYTYACFKLGEKAGVEENYLKSLSIKKRVKDTYGQVNTYMHLAEYYLNNKEKEKAIIHVEKAIKITKKEKYYQGYLKGMHFLGNVYEEQKSKQIFNQLNKVRDSLEIADKKQRESFYKIELLVDEKEKIIEKEKKENRTKKYIIIVLIFVSIILFLFYIVSNIKKRKKINEITLEGSRKITEVALDNIIDARFDTFHKELQGKYNIKEIYLNYWVLRAQRKTKKEIAEKLFLSPDGVASRRKKLIKLLKDKTGKTNVSRSFLVDLYNEEFARFLKK